VLVVDHLVARLDACVGKGRDHHLPERPEPLASRALPGGVVVVDGVLGERLDAGIDVARVDACGEMLLGADAFHFGHGAPRVGGWG